MLPFDRRPWAKTVAAIVIVASFVGTISLAVYFHETSGLHISEVAIIVLLLLTVVPPNAAIVCRKPGQTDPLVSHETFSHTR